MHFLFLYKTGLILVCLAVYVAYTPDRSSNSCSNCHRSFQIAEFFKTIFDGEQGEEEEGQGEQEEGGHRSMEGLDNVPMKDIRSRTKIPEKKLRNFG